MTSLGREEKKFYDGFCQAWRTAKEHGSCQPQQVGKSLQDPAFPPRQARSVETENGRNNVKICLPEDTAQNPGAGDGGPPRAPGWSRRAVRHERTGSRMFGEGKGAGSGHPHRPAQTTELSKAQQPPGFVRPSSGDKTPSGAPVDGRSGLRRPGDTSS